MSASSSPLVAVRSRPAAPKHLLASTIGLALVSAHATAADNTASPPEPPATGPQTTQLKGVQVQANTLNATSPKLTANLLDTPRSIDVIPAQVIQQTGSNSLVDALRTVPGITFGAGEGGNPNGDRPFIRGFDSQSSLFIDGVRSSGSQSREIFDIEQIEVTKGPSSAYNGRGSAGGSINLVTKAPEAHDFMHASVGVGSDAYARATADWNQRVGDDVAFRLNVMDHHSDVPDRNGPQQKRWGVAPSITFGLGQPTSVTLGYYHLHSNDIPDSGIPYDNPFAATSPNAHLNGSGKPIAVPHDTFYGLLDRDFQRQDNDVGTIRVQHDFGGGWLLRNSSVYARSTNDYIWTLPDDSNGNFLLNGGVWRRGNNRVSSTDSLTNQTDLTGEFTTGSIKHSVAIGAELAREKTWRDSYILGAIDPATGKVYPSQTGSIVNGACKPGIGAVSGYWCAPVLNPNPHDPWNSPITRANAPTNIVTNTRSAWAFDTMTLSEQWELNLGARFDSFRTRSTSAAARLSNDSNFWNYQAGLVWKPAKNGSVYLSWGTSSTPPGVDAGDGADGIAVTNQDLKPENSRNLELGSKWSLLDERISLSAAVFRTEMSNARVATGGRGSAQINAGKQRVDGVEIGVNGKLTERWTVYGGYTHLDSKLVKAAPGDPASLGKRFPNTPEDSLSVWTTYAVTQRLTIGGGAFAMGKVYGNADNTKWVPGYTRYDAMAAYVVNPHLTLQLNVQNLTDKYYFNEAYTTHYVAVAPGRAAMLTADFRL
ncbi:MAG: TonB-dependent receptor [Rhodanobacter sp. 68-29]|nr:MAG: TonB-dependent receptor [Rhodanobacter sp. SCN 69-32]OJY61022.1 MAG: TonB-dependent receptor [Rhodanobacter sp. 68-29]